MTTLNFAGLGDVLILRNNCESSKSYTSTTTFSPKGDQDVTQLYKVTFDNSYFGKGFVGIVLNYDGSYTGSNYDKHYSFSFFVDDDNNLFCYSTITGQKGECNVASNELMRLVNISNKSFELNVKTKNIKELLSSNSSLAEKIAKLKK